MLCPLRLPLLLIPGLTSFSVSLGSLMQWADFMVPSWWWCSRWAAAETDTGGMCRLYHASRRGCTGSALRATTRRRPRSITIITFAVYRTRTRKFICINRYRSQRRVGLRERRDAVRFLYRAAKRIEPDYWWGIHMGDCVQALVAPFNSCERLKKTPRTFDDFAVSARRLLKPNLDFRASFMYMYTRKRVNVK